MYCKHPTLRSLQTVLENATLSQLNLITLGEYSFDTAKYSLQTALHMTNKHRISRDEKIQTQTGVLDEYTTIKIIK